MISSRCVYRFGMLRIMSVVGGLAWPALRYSSAKLRFFGTWPWRYSLGSGRQAENLPPVGDMSPFCDDEQSPQPRGELLFGEELPLGLEPPPGEPPLLLPRPRGGRTAPSLSARSRCGGGDSPGGLEPPLDSFGCCRRRTHGTLSLSECGEACSSFQCCALGPSSMMVMLNSTGSPSSGQVSSPWSSTSWEAMLHTDPEDMTWCISTGGLRGGVDMAFPMSVPSLSSSELSAAMVLTEHVEVTCFTLLRTGLDGLEPLSSECLRPRAWQASSSLRCSCRSS
mmetsp:Transcript_86090/g.200173  ORF Transcript_86090/g.200173 Transcript_86090/m.200173 type:complete len:281 (-) Transcript_86090:113-955(-)